jgi:hypothetical protein
MMRTFKGPALASLFTLSAVVLFGCPIYSSSQDYVTCNAQGVCCDESDNCNSWTCGSSAECPANASCIQGYCTGGGGYDAGYGYDSGDCSTAGCPTGFTCTLTNSQATCLPSPDGGGGDGGGDATVGDTSTGDASDAPNYPPFNGCTSNSACTADSGAGAACLDGVCTSASNECSDSTQCPIVGSTQEACVQGVCTPTCAGSTTCPAGYTCSTDGTAVCTGNPTPCGTADGGAACASGTTCVEQHCVPVCNADAGPDSAGACSDGLVCIDHGCIPPEAPKFICQVDGVEGPGDAGAANGCAVGSICLHHNCYIACSIVDSGDAGVGCQTADNFNICKPVQTSSGTYDVCGSNTNLGSQCDPTQGKNCNSPAICIDGYCR